MISVNIKISEIFKGLTFSEEEIEIIESVFQRTHYKKGTVLLGANNTQKAKYYVYSGCLRSYYTDEDGKEHTLQFAIKDWWISDYTILISNGLPIIDIEILQDAILYTISYKEKERLYSKIPKIESFFRKKLERSFGSFQKRILSNLSEPAKQRYKTFLKTYPDMHNCIKNYHIASYLGITTETLSRIRKEM